MSFVVDEGVPSGLVSVALREPYGDVPLATAIITTRVDDLVVAATVEEES